MTEEPAKRWFQATGAPFPSRPAESRSKKVGRYMSCWISSSRVQTTFTGPSTCMAIWTARGTPSISSRRPPPPRVGSRHDLAADPDFAAVLAHMRRAVHRLHGCMREERNLVGRLDLGHRARHRAVGIADVLRNCARAERRLFELIHDLL